MDKTWEEKANDLLVSINAKERITSDNITSLNPNEVFVFGSNRDGWHGGGAAATAHKYFGTVWGQGVGLQGQSYAIPTMEGGIEVIAWYVDESLLHLQRNILNYAF